MHFLKQSTAYTFRLGPFLDDTDGKSPETGLTIAAASVLLSKKGEAYSAKNESTALTGTGTTQGYYTCLLDTTDTGKAGTLEVCCQISGALPVWKEFMVLPANVYDSLIAGSDYLDANVVQWLAVQPLSLADGRVSSAPHHKGVVTVDTTGGTSIGLVSATTSNGWSQVEVGDCLIREAAGDPNYLMVLRVVSVNGTTVTVDRTIPSDIVIGPYTMSVYGSTAPRAATIADAVHDEALAGHTTPGTAGAALAEIDVVRSSGIDALRIVGGSFNGAWLLPSINSGVIRWSMEVEVFGDPDAPSYVDKMSDTTGILYDASDNALASGTLPSYGSTEVWTGAGADSPYTLTAAVKDAALRHDVFSTAAGAALGDILEDTGTTLPGLIGTMPTWSDGTLGNALELMAGAEFDTNNDALTQISWAASSASEESGSARRIALWSIPLTLNVYVYGDVNVNGGAPTLLGTITRAEGVADADPGGTVPRWTGDIGTLIYDYYAEYWKLTVTGYPVYRPDAEVIGSYIKVGMPASFTKFYVVGADPADAIQSDYMRRGTIGDVPVEVATESNLNAVKTQATNAASYSSSAKSQTTAQALRDALKIAPSAGAAEAGSIDALLASIVTTTEDDPDITITVNDTTGTPISDVSVWITSDIAGTTIVKTAVLTDTGGRAVFSNLDSGTYYVWRTKTGRVFTNPQTLAID